MNSPFSPLAFVFPGQGSQFPGMLKELAATHAQVRQTFEEASKRLKVNLWDLSQQGTENELNRTENTQPALLAASVAVWRVWQGQGGARPAFLAGHSLGEYSALVCAESLDLADAAWLVAERGRLMQAAVPEGAGAMAAILGGENTQIIEVCEEMAQGEIVSPANFNAPGQTVIAGHATAVDRVLARLAELGTRKAIKLTVSVPSHCGLMHQAAEQLRECIATLSWQLPTIPVIQNAHATSFNTLSEIQKNLVEQLYCPVRWVECVQALSTQGVLRIAECGPGKVLCGLIKRIDPALDCQPIGLPEQISQLITQWSL